MRENDTRIIGLIGIGLVGTALAKNLLDNKFKVIGYDISDERMGIFNDMGGLPANSPKDVAERSPIIILSLMTSEIIKQVLFGVNGVIENKKCPRLVINTSTCHPTQSEAYAHELSKQEIEFLDAPIAGSSTQIAQREGIFMVGGNEKTYLDHVDIFNAISKHHLYLGRTGAGSRAKIAVNLVLGLNRAILAEGLVFAEMLGIPKTEALRLFSITPAYSKAIDIKGEKMVNEDFTPQAKLSQHRKDVGIMLDIMEQKKHVLPFTRLHSGLLDKAIELGFGELDNSSILGVFKTIGDLKEKKN